MVKRRSLGDALTPDEQAFMEHGTAKKPKQKQKPEPKPKKRKEKTTMPQPALKEDFAVAAPQLPAIAHPLPQVPPITVGLVNLTTRIDPALSAALLRASMDRRIERRERATVQDIVAEALNEWLKKAGYLN